MVEYCEYDELKRKYGKEFDERWYKIKKSEETGLDDFEEIALLGKGSFGEVTLVKERKTGDFFACKAMLKIDIIVAKQVDHVHNEKKIMQAVSFPFLQRLEFSRKDNQYLYLGMPFIHGGDLFSYHRKLRRFSEEQARFYCAQVFLALEYMHFVRIIFRDLKPENILIDSRGYLKLTDFGFAKVVYGRTMTHCGTPEYLAPEIIQSKPYGESVDWWAFGVFVFEMVAGFTPFSEHRHDLITMYAKACDGEYNMPPLFSDDLRSLVNSLLQVDVSRRIGILKGCSTDIRSHAWFSSIDWSAILSQEVEAPFVPILNGEDDVSNFPQKEMTPRKKSKENRHADLFRDF